MPKTDRVTHCYPPHWLEMLAAGTQTLTHEPQERAVFRIARYLHHYLSPLLASQPYLCQRSHHTAWMSLALKLPEVVVGGSLTWPWGTELNEGQPDLGRKGSLIKFCLKVSVFGFVPALICKGMRQVMAPWGLSGLCSQCQPSFSITLSLPAINFGPGSWGLVHLSLLIDTK